MEKRIRKHPRLKNFDYSSDQIYFVTICTQDRQPILSDIVCDENNNAEPILTDIGQTAEEQLFQIEQRFLGVTIEKYVIMPDHIHVVFVFSDQNVGRGLAPAVDKQNSARETTGASTLGASSRPTLMDAMRAFKSLTTRLCNEMCGTQGRKIFQTSFYEHIVRDQQEFNEICKYIEDNPINWIFPL